MVGNHYEDYLGFAINDFIKSVLKIKMDKINYKLILLTRYNL